MIFLKNHKIKSFLQKPFSLLDDSVSKLFLVVFGGVFSSFFLYYYNPFNLQEVTYNTALGQNLPIWFAGIFGALILSFTQFALRSINSLKTLNIKQYLLWGLFELSIICIGVFILFGESKEPFLIEFMQVVKYTISLAAIPYILACLIIAVKKLSDESEEADSLSNSNMEQLFFRDENGKIMLAIEPTQILFLKSESNYTSIVFLQNDKIEKKLIRTTLKLLEAELEYSHLIRVHRSYMVNLLNIVSMQRKKSGYELFLKELPGFAIKVSGTYKHIFESKFKIGQN